jgi:flagellar hook-length control protein FliK
VLFDAANMMTLETIGLEQMLPGMPFAADADAEFRPIGAAGPLSLEPRQQIPLRVVQMIAQAARNLPDQPIQLALSPEELGSVRLTLHTTENAMNVSVAVERPETLELLRRNIELLASELRELGYSNLTFEFAQNQQNQDQHEQGKGQFNARDNPAISSQAELPKRTGAIALTGASDRIDIRL